MTNELGRLTGIIFWGLYHIFFSINTLLYAYTFLHKKLGVVANLKKKKPIISLVVSLILFPLNMNSRPLESVRQVLPKLICSDSTDILKYFWCASDYISNSDNYRKLWKITQIFEQTFSVLYVRLSSESLLEQLDTCKISGLSFNGLIIGPPLSTSSHMVIIALCCPKVHRAPESNNPFVGVYDYPLMTMKRPVGVWELNLPGGVKCTCQVCFY